MELLLHIGTHKTATTSIQHFCARQRKLLRQNGFLYPKNSDSAYVMNNLASQMVHGKEERTHKFIKDSYKRARKVGCRKVVISGESFYAMAGFFKVLAGENMPREEYFHFEDQYLEKLKSFCQDFSSVKIFCVLRPQDEYANALYNQMVKNTRGIQDNYLSFINSAQFIFDYERHIQLWAKYFGTENIYLADFKDLKPDPVQYFCSRFLQEEICQNAGQKIHSNKRLSRDVLEFKRIKNGEPFDRAKAFISIQCYHQLSEEFPDLKGWQIFAPLAERQAFFSDYQKGNEKLRETYGLTDLKTMTAFEESRYPGLSREKAAQIENRLNKLLSKPLNKLELWVRKFIHRVIASFPFIDDILQPVRSMRNRFRLYIQEW